MRASDPTGIPATGSDAPSLQALTLRGILAVDGVIGINRGHDLIVKLGPDVFAILVVL